MTDGGFIEVAQSYHDISTTTVVSTWFGIRRAHLRTSKTVKLACGGCDWASEGETADALHAAMLAHGDEATLSTWPSGDVEMRYLDPGGGGSDTATVVIE